MRISTSNINMDVRISYTKRGKKIFTMFLLLTAGFIPSMKTALNGKHLSEMTYTTTHAQVQRPRGEILPGSPALFPVLFLCEELVLFKYNGGVKETAAPVT